MEAPAALGGEELGNQAHHGEGALGLLRHCTQKLPREGGRVFQESVLLLGMGSLTVCSRARVVVYTL